MSIWWPDQWEISICRWPILSVHGTCRETEICNVIVHIKIICNLERAVVLNGVWETKKPRHMISRILHIGCLVFSFSRYKNSSSYKDEYRQVIKRSFCKAVKNLVWMWIQLNRPTFLNFLLATHIPLEPTDSTSLRLWVQKLKILATFKRLHLNKRNKIVCCANF